MPTAAKDSPDLSAVFADLAIEQSSEPLPEPVRGGASAGPNPFEGPLQHSVDNSTPYSFYVPPQAIKRAIFLINAAARKLNVGVRIVVNVQRDAQGKLVKNAQGQSVAIVEKDGANKGKVLVRFQGKKERKQQTAPRPFSIVKDKADTKGETYIVRRRSDKQAMFKGTHEQAKAEYERLTTEARNTPVEQPQPTQQAQTDASPTGGAAA